MRKTIIILLIFTVFGLGSVAAGDIIDSPVYAPMTPEVIGQGGSFTAVAHGYNSLFTNPAGFARDGGSFTLLSATASPYFLPSDEDMQNIDSVMAAETEESIANSLMGLEEVITGNGIGAAGNAGIGLVNNGLGLGIVGNMDFYGRGETVLGTSIDAVYDWAVIGGLAVPVNLGPVTAYVGGDLRYMLRAEARDVGIIEFAKAAGDGAEPSFEVYSGAGLGFDFGTILELGKWTVGFSARDIGGTDLSYKKNTADNLDQIMSFDGSGEDIEETYSIPMVTSYGIGYDPDGFLLPSWLFDPVFHAEYRKTHYQAEDAKEDSFWTGVHMGMEAKVLRFIKLRSGINQGYATFGAGVKLLFLDLNASYFTREMGRYAGVKPNEGFTLEAAIRF